MPIAENHLTLLSPNVDLTLEMVCKIEVLCSLSNSALLTTWFDVNTLYYITI